MSQKIIKFRVWNGAELSYDDSLYHLDLCGNLYTTTGYDGECNSCCGFGYVLQRFTGLHDKNGKEIYEGDLLKWNPEMKTGGFDQLFIVKWYQEEPVFGNSLGGFRLFGTKYNKDRPHQLTCGSSILDIKVVGNIYESSN